MRKLEIDLSDCDHCGICTDLCPTVFRDNHAGFVEVLFLNEYPDEVNDVIQNCRNQCIAWKEA